MWLLPGFVLLKQNSVFQIPSSFRNDESLKYLPDIFVSHCGGGGIWTHERISPLPVFETGTFNHSVTPPIDVYYPLLPFFQKMLYFLCCSWFMILNSWFLNRPYRLTVRTRAFQARNRGSIPRRVTHTENFQSCAGNFLYVLWYLGGRIEGRKHNGAEAGSRKFSAENYLWPIPCLPAGRPVGSQLDTFSILHLFYIPLLSILVFCKTLE